MSSCRTATRFPNGGEDPAGCETLPRAVSGLPLCDIHAHLADERLAGTLEALLNRAATAGMIGILVNAARISEWPAVLELSGRPGLYGALGVHPFFVRDWSDASAAALEAHLTAQPRSLRAIGEIGLDFQHGRDNADRQLEVFAAQLECACRHRVPVIVHNRRSWGEFFAVLRDFSTADFRGVCHHFTGSREIARQVLDRGFYLSFCGPLTYPNARRIREAARYAPLDRVLTETDTPDLPPASFRGQPSRPWHVYWVLEEIARLKGLSIEETARAVARNFARVLDCGRVPPGDA